MQSTDFEEITQITVDQMREGTRVSKEFKGTEWV